MFTTEPNVWGHSWNNHTGVIHGPRLTSQGVTRNDWPQKLRNRGFNLVEDAGSVLQVAPLTPVIGRVTQTVILLPDCFVGEGDGTGFPLEMVQEKARSLGLRTPSVEAPFLLRILLSDTDVRSKNVQWLAVMHEPVQHRGYPRVFGLRAFDNGNGVHAAFAQPGRAFNKKYGFVFEAPTH